MKENAIYFRRRAAVNTPVVVKAPIEHPAIIAESIEIETSNKGNVEQYRRVVESYEATNGAMDFEDIAGAGEYLGDKVVRIETYAHLRPGWQQQKSGIVKKEDKILAWQTRGRTVSVMPALAAPRPETHQELTIVSTELATVEPTQESTLEVIEGIEVSLSPASLDQERESTPYLKKAA